MSASAVSPQPDPNPPDPNVDMVRKVVEHHYFRSLVEQLVREQTETALQKYKKRMIAPALAAISAAGLFGYNYHNSLAELKADAEQHVKEAEARVTAGVKSVEEQARTVDRFVHEGEQKLVEVQTNATKAEAAVADAQRNVTEGRAYLNDASQKAERLTASAGAVVTQAMNRQQDIFKQAAEVNQGAVSLLQHTREVDLTELQRNADLAKKAATDAQSASTAATGASRDLQTYGLKRLQQELIQARSIKYVVVRTGEPQEVSIFDPTDPEGKRKYEMRITADRLDRNQVVLRVLVHRLWSDEKKEETLSGIHESQPQPLQYAPGLSLTLDSLKHQHLSHSFALVRISADESPVAR